MITGLGKAVRRKRWSPSSDWETNSRENKRFLLVARAAGVVEAIGYRVWLTDGAQGIFPPLSLLVPSW